MICPEPKTNNVKEMNDLRPIALTSVLMKSLERIVLSLFLPVVQSQLDPFQFAYKSKRGVEDAIVLFTHNIYEHLDKPKTYVRTLFIDFSSAFNTIQPHLLIPKLRNLGVCDNISAWILEFLTFRPQFVTVKTSSSCYKSNVITTNTGAPQGTVLSPVLFSIYTNDCKTSSSQTPIIKYADDTSISGLITQQEDLLNYFSVINYFVEWCERHFLLLNVKKTKEIIFDFRIKKNVHGNVLIGSEQVEVVNNYKYLGIIFDDKLTWEMQTNKVSSKLNQRLFFLRKLSKFNVDNTLLFLFFNSCIHSIYTFCAIAWGGNCSNKQKNKINSVIKRSDRIIKGEPLMCFDNVFLELCNKKLINVMKDMTHPLNSNITHSSRNVNRLIHVKCRTSRYMNSFLPISIKNYHA